MPAESAATNPVSAPRLKTMLGMIEVVMRDREIPRAQLPGEIRSVFMKFLREKPLAETVAAAMTLRGKFLREPVFMAIAGELIRQGAFSKALQVLEALDSEPKPEYEEGTPVKRHVEPQPDIMPKAGLLVALWERAKRYGLTAGGDLRNALLDALCDLKPDEVTEFFQEASSNAKDKAEQERLQEFREMLVNAMAMQLAEKTKESK